MTPGLYAWALLLAAVGGIVLATGSLTQYGRNLAIVALVLFTTSAVLTLVGAWG